MRLSSTFTFTLTHFSSTTLPSISSWIKKYSFGIPAFPVLCISGLPQEKKPTLDKTRRVEKKKRIMSAPIYSRVQVNDDDRPISSHHSHQEESLVFESPSSFYLEENSAKTLTSLRSSSPSFPLPSDVISTPPPFSSTSSNLPHSSSTPLTSGSSSALFHSSSRTFQSHQDGVFSNLVSGRN